MLVLKRIQFTTTDTRASTPSGQIIYPIDKFKDDFSTPNVSALDKTIFIHEMTHIWQHQLKYPATQNGVIIQLKNELGGSVYAYLLSLNKKLKDYNVEQQGNILADYYMMYHFYDTTSIILSGKPYFQNKQQSAYLTVPSDFLRNPKNASKNLPDNLSFNTLRGCC